MLTVTTLRGFWSLAHLQPAAGNPSIAPLTGQWDSGPKGASPGPVQRMGGAAQVGIIRFRPEKGELAGSMQASP